MPSIARNINFNFEFQTGILTKRHIGEITILDIIDSWEWAFKTELIPDGTKRFLLDYREAIVHETLKSSESIVKFYHNNIDQFRDSKFAIVSENPKNVALSMLVQKQDSNYQSRPFSTIEKAIDWLIE
jgi:hypothetical protein